jgi:hypothetical protein
LQEVGQKEMREIECDGATMWLAEGRPNKNGKGGDSIDLGMVLCRDAMRAWKDGGGRRKMDYPSERITDCRLLVQDCSGKEVSTHLVNAHAPIGRKSRNEWDAFFADLEASISPAATRDIVVIGGDFKFKHWRKSNCDSEGSTEPVPPPWAIRRRLHQRQSGKRLLR